MPKTGIPAAEKQPEIFYYEENLSDCILRKRNNIRYSGRHFR